MTDFLLARTWPERQRRHLSWAVRCFAEAIRLVHIGRFGDAADYFGGARSSARKLVKLQELAARRGIANARGAVAFGPDKRDPDSILVPERWA